MTEKESKTNYKIVTSFNLKLWHKFARKTVGTILEAYNNTDQEIILWFDHNNEVEEFFKQSEKLSENIRGSSLDQLPPFVDFIRRFDGDVPFKDRGIDKSKINPGMLFRYNYVPFAKKVYSWAFTYLNMQPGEVLVWLDADIVLTNKIEPEHFDVMLPEDFDMCFLDRDFPWYAAETGFFMIRKTPASDEFVNLILRAYASGFIFDMSEWHDGYVFKTMLKMSSELRSLNLNPVPKERDVFERSMLADFMLHYKGGKKNELKETQKSDVDTLVEFDPQDQGYE